MRQAATLCRQQLTSSMNMLRKVCTITYKYTHILLYCMTFCDTHHIHSLHHTQLYTRIHAYTLITLYIHCNPSILYTYTYTGGANSCSSTTTLPRPRTSRRGRRTSTSTRLLQLSAYVGRGVEGSGVEYTAGA